METKEKVKRFSSTTWGFIAVIVTLIIIFLVVPAYKEAKEKAAQEAKQKDINTCEMEYTSSVVFVGDMETERMKYMRAGWLLRESDIVSRTTGMWRLNFKRCKEIK